MEHLKKRSLKFSISMPQKNEICTSYPQTIRDKSMRTAIMKRSKVATKLRAEATDFIKKTFKKQKNFCNRLYKERRKKYYEKSEKTTTGMNIKVLKYDVDICALILMEIFNNCIKNGTFPDKLKLADISSTFKSLDITDKKNYRPISRYHNISY